MDFSIPQELGGEAGADLWTLSMFGVVTPSCQDPCTGLSKYRLNGCLAMQKTLFLPLLYNRRFMKYLYEEGDYDNWKAVKSNLTQLNEVQNELICN